jgi:hypothetical protein
VYLAQALEIITVDSESKAKQITDRRRRMEDLRRSVENEQQHQVILKKKAAEAAIEEAVQGIYECMAYLFSRLLFFVCFVNLLDCMFVFLIMF